ncbi:MAG: PhnD/SsuA/transferrin family substrate-binding protein [Cyanobacteria bacterium SBLK]|nr:PhnD/SsuA/transferrin family substrate-binding protein [Cyanobacteria bacterium SBLK]
MKRRNFLGYSGLGMGLALTATSCRSSVSDREIAPPKQLRFTVTDVPTLEELERDYEALRQALDEILQVPIVFVPVRNYVAAAGDFHNNRLDLAWAGPSEYVVITARSQAVPLLELTRPGFHSIIVVRADRGIQSLADLKGKTIEMGKPTSTVRFLGGFKILQEAGIDPLEEMTISHSSNRGFDALKTGKVDAGVKASITYQQSLEKGEFKADEYPIIARGETLPSDIFVASSYLDTAFVAEMRDRVLDNSPRLIAAIHSASDNFAQRFRDSEFVPADDTNYDIIREIYQLLGEDEFL